MAKYYPPLQTGRAAIMANLRREIQGIENRTAAGLLKAGLVVEGESNILAPVDTGALVNSSFTRQIDENEVVVGYGAAYAPFVHEKPGQQFQKPGAEHKFLEKAVDRNADQIVQIIAQEAKVR
jgi:hypothetical protein